MMNRDTPEVAAIRRKYFDARDKAYKKYEANKTEQAWRAFAAEDATLWQTMADELEAIGATRASIKKAPQQGAT